MKKLLIGAVVGGLILFFWQFLSWSLLGLHDSMNEYTPKQTEILKYLDENLDDGFYYLPTLPPGYTMEQMEKLTNDGIGKPWAQVYMHKSMSMDMASNIGRGVFTSILAVLLISWILLKIGKTTFLQTFLCCLAIGLSAYITTTYSYSIWYQTKTLADLFDGLTSWGLVGIWLGWWLNRD
jgi:hypothetical protein